MTAFDPPPPGSRGPGSRGPGSRSTGPQGSSPHSSDPHGGTPLGTTQRGPAPPPAFTPHFTEGGESPRFGATPWIAGAAALVLAAAAIVWLRPTKTVPEAPPPEPVPEPAIPTTAASQLLPPNPLAISRLAIDARARAATWQKEAELAEVRLTIADGKPRDLVFSFALPRGHFSPGIPLTGKHFELAFDAERREFAEREVSTGPALGAADPNCPLDAAYRAATQAGLSAQTLRTSYAYSAKHRRELWTFQGAGKPLLVDGANCAILVR